MNPQRAISVIGLGYVGLPVAVAFAQTRRVIGFDINTARIAELQRGQDHTGEVQPEALKAANLHLTSRPADLREADFHIVAVPTPVDSARDPDLGALVGASEMLGGQLKPGDVVVYESTVYPGVTEEVCVPVLERASGLALGRDFSVGYSPERINPGDKQHAFTNILKVVSASDPETLDIVAEVYGSVVRAGIHRAPNIRIAEAAKVIENTQRDLNIALMNELAMLFHRLQIDTQEVLAAASTKWNFLPFTPGLVGGHCIGVDPYYLTYKARQLGLHPEVVLAGRRINDGMTAYVAQRLIKAIVRNGRRPRPSRVTVLGITFKEDVPDTRNSKVAELVGILRDHGLEVQAHDPLIAAHGSDPENGLTITPFDQLKPAQCVVLAVPHAQYREGGWRLLRQLLDRDAIMVMDIRGALNRSECPEGIEYWRL